MPELAGTLETIQRAALPGFCVESDCSNKPETGAHVQLETDHLRWYIIPLCKEHNAMRGHNLTIINTVKPVPADIRETCGKK